MKSIPLEQITTKTRLSRFVLILFMLLTLAVITVVWHLRSDALDSQSRELGLLSLALTDELDRGLQGVEEGLNALRVELKVGRLSDQNVYTAQALRTRAELMPLVQTLWLIDRTGKVLSASEKFPIPDLNSFTPVLESLSTQLPAISRPFMDTGTKQMMVAIAARIEQTNENTDRWVLAAIPAASFLGAFSAAVSAEDARMAVFRSDGVLLAGSVIDVAKLDEAGVARRLIKTQVTELRQFPDGSERLIGLNSLPRYQIKVLLTRNLDAILMGWREMAQLSMMVLLLIYLLMAASVYFVQKADRRRVEALHALQAELSRAGKLESLGTLAGGVAHDFNNVLAGIIGFGEMAQDAATPDSAQARHLDKMLKAALRGKALVERILAFSRGGAHQSIVFEFQAVVEEVLGMLTVSLQPGVVIERGLQAPGAKLRGDPTQAFEAVMNLCTNAMQAMPQGGMLSVLLERQQIDQARVLSHSQLEPGNYLVLSVADQGAGISPEVMERLFVPFFTTKRAQSGTGLGLAVVHGVVGELSGSIDVQSKLHHGARFILYLPECFDRIEPSSSELSFTPQGKGQTVLVVDDDPDLVSLHQEWLTQLGYTPLAYSDPLQAQAEFIQSPSKFSAILTDEVMPGLNGTQLTQAIRKLAPQIPVVLISGYGGAQLAARAADAGVSKVLSKPLQREALAQALNELIT